MLDSILPTPVKLTHSEILFSAAATLAFQVIEKGGRPIIRLSRLCEKPQYGYTASAQAEGVGPRFLRITDIKAGSVDWKNVPYCDCPEPEKYLLKPGDILVARSGSVGKSFLVSECPEPTVFASYMIRMRAKPGVLAGYVYWYLQTQQFWFQIKESKRGSAMKNINSKMLSSARIPDATPSQQRAVVSFLRWFQNRIDGDYKTPPPEVPELLDVPRIVARIEELAALIEEARGLRVKAREEVEVLLSTALAGVFARADEEGWTRKKLNKVAPVNMGQSPPGDTYNREGEGLPLLNGPTEFGMKHPEPIQWTRDPTKVCNPNDILICVRGATTGRMNWADQVYCIGRGLAALTVDQSQCLPEYVYYFLQHQTRIILDEARGSTFPNLPGGKLKVFPIPVPSLDEQRRIVAYLDDLQAQADELAALQDDTQAELDALLPSLLDRAFRGEL